MFPSEADSRGGDQGDRSPKTYENIFIHLDFLQFGKQGWRYKQGCGVGGKISDSNSALSKISDLDFPKFPTPTFPHFRLLNVKEMKFGW